MYRCLILFIACFLINTSVVAEESVFLLSKLSLENSNITLKIEGKNGFKVNFNCKAENNFPKVTIIKSKNFIFDEADIANLCSSQEREQNYYQNLNVPIKFAIPNKKEPFSVEMNLLMPACNPETGECIMTESILLLDSKENSEIVDLVAREGSRDDSKEHGNFIYALLLAFVGGVILNFMPCVLPIIALKINSFSKIGQKERGAVISKSFATLLGILFSYIIIALFTVYLKRVGENFGYGFFFQNSNFIILICIALIVFGSSLLGSSVFYLPSGLATKLHNISNKTSLAGDFLTGCFASLMSTPCSAPFITTATAFAIGAANDLQIILIFVSIGLGLGIVYLLLIFAPGVVKFLPKPGAWQDNFNKILASLIYLSFFAFIYVLSTQIGIVSSVVLLMLMILLKFFIEVKLNYFLKTSLIFVVLISAFKLPFIYHQEELKQELLDKSLWHEFSMEQINKELKKGRIVFIDVTASWCATCQLNKFLVLENRNVINFFKEKNIYLVRYDASNSLSQEIKDFLAPYHRYGVPINIILEPRALGAQNKNGLLLPVLLSPKDIYESINVILDK